MSRVEHTALPFAGGPHLLVTLSGGATVQTLASHFLVCSRMEADKAGSVTMRDIVKAPTIAQTINSARPFAVSDLPRRNCLATTSTSVLNPAVAVSRVASSARTSSLPSATGG